MTKSKIHIAATIITGIIIINTMMACTAVQTGAKYAQSLVQGVHFGLTGGGASHMQFSSKYIYIRPQGNARFVASTQWTGEFYSLNTSKDPGPWCFEIVIGDENTPDEWVQLQAKGMMVCADEFEIPAQVQMMWNSTARGVVSPETVPESSARVYIRR